MDFDPGMDDYDSDYIDFDLCMDDDELDCPDYHVAAFGSTHFSASVRDTYSWASWSSFLGRITALTS